MHCLCLSPDNARLYSGGADGAVRAWEHLEEGRCTLTMSVGQRPDTHTCYEDHDVAFVLHLALHVIHFSANL